MRRTVLTGITTMALLGASALITLPAHASALLVVGNSGLKYDAGTCTVDASGSLATYATITDAVSAASTGDTILVCAGTYAESLTVSKALTFEGANAGAAGYDPRGPETIIDPSGPVALALSGPDTAVSGFTIEGSTSDTAAVEAYGSGDSVTDDIFTGNKVSVFSDHDGLTVSGNSFGPPLAAFSSVVLHDGTSEATIDSNHFVGGPSTAAITLEADNSTSDLVIQGNTADLTGGGGFAVIRNAGAPSITDNVITGDADSADGIHFAGGVSSASVTDNTISGLQSASAIVFSLSAGDQLDNLGGTVNSNLLQDNHDGLEVSDISTTTTLNAHGNVLVGNSDTGVLDSSPFGSVDATNNFWGCNQGPGKVGCDSFDDSSSGSFTYAPWAVLGSGTAVPSIVKGSTTGLTADLTHNSNGDVMSNLVPDNALTAKFSFDLGSASPVSAPIVGGLAEAIITGTTVGSGSARVSVVNSTSTTPVMVTAPPKPTLPALTIHDASTAEGNSGTHGLTFSVTLSKKATKAVTVHFTTVNGSAIAGQDFIAKSGLLTIAKGKTSATITILIKGDKVKEPNETFAVNIFSPTDAKIADPVGTGVIRNDDK